MRTARDWWVPLGVTSMGLSLGVNTLVSALMISRIWYVYAQTRDGLDQAESRLSWIASILLESALALFAAQLLYLVLYKIEHPAFALVAGPVTIVYVRYLLAVVTECSLEFLRGSTARPSWCELG